MGYYSDDPVRDAERYAEAMDRRLECLPVCSICDDAVQDDYCYQIQGEVVCPRCMRIHYRVRTRNLVERSFML